MELSKIASDVPVMAGTSSGKKENVDSTAPKFGEVWSQIQSKYGVKAEKPREIKKTMGKDDFLKIMITQMQHQDPTEPLKAEKFATELAQFTSLEQLQNMNQTLTKLTSQNQPLERLALTQLIGKTITVDKDRFQHTEGEGEVLKFVLPADAEEAKVSLVSDGGEILIEKNLGALAKGENVFEWDGRRSNKMPAKSGSVIFQVAAVDTSGKPVQVSSKYQTQVVGVSFEGPEPVLLTGNFSKPETVSMKNVTRIDTSPLLSDAARAQSLLPGAKLLGSPTQEIPIPTSAELTEKTPAMFTFKKGEGSRTLSTEELSNEHKKQLEDVSSQSANRLNESEEKGFPNGLSGKAE